MADHIKTFLSNFMDNQTDWKINLLHHWSEIIGNLHSHVTIEKITDNTLVLGVFDSSWMQELYILSPVLLKTINQKLDQPRIKKVRFTLVGQKKKYTKQPSKEIKRKKHKPRALTCQEKKALGHIKDPMLRNALAAFRTRCKQEDE